MDLLNRWLFSLIVLVIVVKDNDCVYVPLCTWLCTWWLIDQIIKFETLEQFFWSGHLVSFYKEGVLKRLAKFTGKHLYWSFFLIKLQALMLATLLKKDSGIGIAFWIVKKNLRTPTMVCRTFVNCCFWFSRI